MELSFLLFQKILSMAVMVMMGFAVVKAKILSGNDSRVLSSLCLYVIGPCLILSAFQLEYNQERMAGLLIAFLAAGVIHLINIPAAYGMGKLFRLDRVERASLIYSNGGNLIVPLVSSLLGKEFVFYCCAFIAVQTFLMWTHLPGLLEPKATPNLKQVVTNPNIIAIVVGIFSFFGQITYPEILGEAIAAVGDSIGPVCMMMLGMLMADVNVRETFAKPRFYLVCMGRLVFFPLLAILLFWATGITDAVPLAKKILVVTVLAASAPVAVTVTAMTDLFRLDANKAGAINVMSVIICILTMPMMVGIYQILCGN